MKRLLLTLLATVVLVPVAPAWATGGGEGENMAQTARALSLQALALLEQGRGHEEATEKLDEALASDVPGEIDLRAIRAAHSALHRADVEAAKRLLQDAFPGDDGHVVGVTFRPEIGTATVAAGIGGGVVLGVALAALLWRRRVDERRAASPSAR